MCFHCRILVCKLQNKMRDRNGILVLPLRYFYRGCGAQKMQVSKHTLSKNTIKVHVNEERKTLISLSVSTGNRFFIAITYQMTSTYYTNVDKRNITLIVNFTFSKNIAWSSSTFQTKLNLNLTILSKTYIFNDEIASKQQKFWLHTSWQQTHVW